MGALPSGRDRLIARPPARQKKSEKGVDNTTRSWYNDHDNEREEATHMADRHRKTPERTKYQQRWAAGHMTTLALKLNNNTDADILAKLDQVPSKQGYVKQLIRADIAASPDPGTVPEQKS